MNKTIPTAPALEEFNLENTSPWFQIPKIDFNINKGTKKETAEAHKGLIQSLLGQSKLKNAFLYTDGSKIEQETGAGLFSFFKD